MGRHGDAGDLEHHAAAGEDLRERRAGAGTLLPGGRAVRGVVRRQEGQVPQATRRDAAENLKSGNLEIWKSRDREMRFAHYPSSVRASSAGIAIATSTSDPVV